MGKQVKVFIDCEYAYISLGGDEPMRKILRISSAESARTVLVDGTLYTGFLGLSVLSTGSVREAYCLLAICRFAQGAGQKGVVRNAHFSQCHSVSGLVDEAFAVECCLFRLVFMRFNIIFANGGAVHLNGGAV